MYPDKIRISNGEGQVGITAISRAFEVAEDLDLSKYTSVEHDSDKDFLVIPLTAGTVKVHLCGAPSIGTYTVSEVEVSAAYSQSESGIPSYSIEIKGLDSGQILYYYRNWETRRTSNDGMKALLHEETYNMPVPPIMMLPEGEEVMEDAVYPYPLVDENEIMNSNEWTKNEEL